MQKGPACRQAGFSPIIILVSIVIMAVVAALAYFFGKSFVRTPFSQSQVSTSLSSSDKGAKFPELNGFPIYPGAIFIQSGMSQICNQGQQIEGLKVCNNTIYQWVTTDDFDRVSSWYAEATKKAGWECNGGAGQYTSPRDASGFGNKCIKVDVDPYELSYDANSDSTKIALEVLRESLYVEQSDETANWKTYTNKTYGYSLNYPDTILPYINKFTRSEDPDNDVEFSTFKGSIDNGGVKDWYVTISVI
ncbi:MAG: hypothetical protein NUV73_03140, partial [Candidatus Daviesbacteria bacterium]|nr:hypothetical protein [Candidatus Daviesbacteria bacterium]